VCCLLCVLVDCFLDCDVRGLMMGVCLESDFMIGVHNDHTGRPSCSLRYSPCPYTGINKDLVSNLVGLNAVISINHVGQMVFSTTKST
jgi:hypothetical protein